jgi:hypothetical protein
MRRHTLLALSLATGLALPIGFSTAAHAVSASQRDTLGDAAWGNPATMQAAIATVLQDLAQDRPLAVALDELAAVLLELGATEEFKAEFAVALVMAAQDLAAAGALPGMTADAAGEAAAEAVLVRAQGSPSLVAAIVANASAMAADDVQGGQGTAIVGAFLAAATSPLIDMANQAAVRQALATVDTLAPIGNLASAQFGNGGMGAGPQIGGMNFANTSRGGAGRGGGGGSGEQVGTGQSISPN